MVEDFTLFRQIEQTEYVDYIFDLKVVAQAWDFTFQDSPGSRVTDTYSFHTDPDPAF